MNAESERPLDRLDHLRPDPQGLMKAPWCIREPDSTNLSTRPKPPDWSERSLRTGRVAANLPLLSGHCAPLSFAGVEKHDDVVAMLGVHERNDVAVAVDLFEWLYQRSMQKYPWMLG